MSPAVELVPIEQVWIHVRGPAARRGKFVSEETYSHREIDPPRIVRPPKQSVLFKIETRGGSRGSGQPIKRDLVEHLVASEGFLRVAVFTGAGVENIVDPS